MTQPLRPASKTGYRIQKLLIVLLAIVWLSAGIAKLAALSTFKDVLDNHGVLSPGTIEWAWVIPVVEIITGLLVLFAGGNPRLTTLRRTAAIMSMSLLVGFCFYIWQVPEDVFQSVGCGCEGALGLTDFTGAPSRLTAIGIDLVLASFSWAVWKGAARPTPESAIPKP